VLAASADRPVFHRQRPYRCTAANWRLGPTRDSRIATNGTYYSMTSSARSGKAGGMLNPIAFAVLSLMIMLLLVEDGSR